MKHWRRRCFPPNPTNLAGFLDQLRQPCYSNLLNYERNLITINEVTDIDGCLHLIFYDSEFVQNVMSGATKIFVDGTFQTTPRPTDAYQLVMVMAVRFNHVSLL